MSTSDISSSPNQIGPEAQFNPLFEGHLASDDAFSIDDQIATLRDYLVFKAASWDRSAKRAPATPQARAWYAQEKNRDLAPLRAAIATLIRARPACGGEGAHAS